MSELIGASAANGHQRQDAIEQSLYLLLPINTRGCRGKTRIRAMSGEVGALPQKHRTSQNRLSVVTRGAFDDVLLANSIII